MQHALTIVQEHSQRPLEAFLPQPRQQLWVKVQTAQYPARIRPVLLSGYAPLCGASMAAATALGVAQLLGN
jgi:hypothetical protein